MHSMHQSYFRLLAQLSSKALYVEIKLMYSGQSRKHGPETRQLYCYNLSSLLLKLKMDMTNWRILKYAHLCLCSDFDTAVEVLDNPVYKRY